MRPWREPLVWFGLAGAGLFGLHAWLGPPAAAPAEVIRITPEALAAAVEAWRAQTGHDPSPSERRALVADLVRQEVLVREALALGLERGDHVVRERLAQVMGFAAEDRAAIGEPDDAALAAFVAAHADDYREPDRVSFAHVFFDRNRADPVADARAALAALQAGGDGAGGDAFDLGRAFERRSATELRFLFGAEFVAALAAAPTGEWTGPVASAQGVHCVRVTAREAGAMPALAAVRERAAAHWLDEQRRVARDRDFEARRGRYRVVYAEGVPAPEAR